MRFIAFSTVSAKLNLGDLIEGCASVSVVKLFLFPKGFMNLVVEEIHNTLCLLSGYARISDKARSVIVELRKLDNRQQQWHIADAWLKDPRRKREFRLIKSINLSNLGFTKLPGWFFLENCKKIDLSFNNLVDFRFPGMHKLKKVLI